MGNQLQFRHCPMFFETAKSFPQLKDKFLQFLQMKEQNPIAPFGASDRPFIGAGNFASAIPGLKHAHLNKDVSIVYLVHGKNPTQIDLYGFYSHADLGTGQPANMNKQKSMSKKFINQNFGK